MSDFPTDAVGLPDTIPRWISDRAQVDGDQLMFRESSSARMHLAVCVPSRTTVIQITWCSLLHRYKGVSNWESSF